jgi:hypothetical protein
MCVVASECTSRYRWRGWRPEAEGEASQFPTWCLLNNFFDACWEAATWRSLLWQPERRPTPIRIGSSSKIGFHHHRTSEWQWMSTPISSVIGHNILMDIPMMSNEGLSGSRGGPQKKINQRDSFVQNCPGYIPRGSDSRKGFGRFRPLAAQYITVERSRSRIKCPKALGLSVINHSDWLKQHPWNDCMNPLLLAILAVGPRV